MNPSGQPQQSFQAELRRHIVRASQISSQTWCELGVSDELFPHAVASSSLEVTAERVTSLLLVRLIVLATPNNKFKDLSTATVCQTLLGPRYISCDIPAVISETVVQELRTFILAMLRGYNNVPYHNYKHAYHVLLSSSTLMDMILKNNVPTNLEGMANDGFEKDHSSRAFEKDGIMQMALLFSALIHDTEHQGVPNAQLVSENNPLALQYNDQSVAEQRSLTVAFLELLQPAYDNLREVMFSKPDSGVEYRRFRGAVTNLILATDISTPARGKEVRDRWESVFKRAEDASPKTSQDTRKAPKSTPILSPPREHPTPSRSPRKSVMLATGIPYLDTPSPQNSWIECGTTPSTHFPHSAAVSSMHDSLAFWWFSTDQPTEDDDYSVKTFSDDDTSATASFSNLEMNKPSEETGRNGLDASISLFSDYEKCTPDETTVFSNEFPTESNAFQFSCSTFSDDGSHHLLSSSRVCRPRHSFSRSSSGFSRSDRRLDSSAGYCDMSASGNDSIGSKPRTILDHAISACTPKRRRKKAEILVGHFEAITKKASSHVDSESSSSLLSGALTADLTYTDVSSAKNTAAPPGFNSSSNIHFTEANDDSSVQGDEEVDLLGEICKEMLLTGEIEEVPLRGEPASAPVIATDEKNRSLSLSEHILLVADVSHTMQSWDTMNMFALRLSKEIMKSIKKGRSGGIKDDPLDDWYSNQSAFLHGYILPLAERLEQTGTLPPAEDRASDGFLSSQIQKNLERWQEHGHDVIAGWRRDRERRCKKKALNKDKKKYGQKSRAGVPSEEEKRTQNHPKVVASKKSTKSGSQKKIARGKTHTKE